MIFIILVSRSQVLFFIFARESSRRRNYGNLNETMVVSYALAENKIMAGHRLPKWYNIYTQDHSTGDTVAQDSPLRN